MRDRDDLSAERANRIADGLEAIERDLNRLRELQSLTIDDYTADGNQDVRAVVERRFETLTEATLDVSRQLVRQEGRSVPDRRKATIDVLEDLGILDSDVSERLREAVAFRDVLAHTYGPVIDDELVYDALQDGLDRFVLFVQAVDRYVTSFEE